MIVELQEIICWKSSMSRNYTISMQEFQSTFSQENKLLS